ncbi:hypothetical protein [Paraburkholderia ribeironis]|nr:hypothetical protein [Paraburkholderia ribeironis]
MKLQTKLQSAVAEVVGAFINKARASNPFGDIEWDDIVWEVPNKARASDGRTVERIWFTAAFVAKSTRANAVAFPGPFGDFVKAYACHIERQNPEGLSTLYHNIQVRAFRYLYAAFGNTRQNPWEVRPAHFDVAIGECQKREERSSAYRIGVALAAIANTMDEYRLCEVRLNWVNPIRRDTTDGGIQQWKVGQEAKERRNKKLPTSALVETVGAISNRDDLSDSDLVRQRAMELCVCCGFRPCELLTLHVKCWIEEPQLDEYGQPMLGPGGKPAIRYGIRNVPAKRGFENTQIKWLPTVMVDVAKRALSDIKKVSEPFRKIARFMANRPGRTLLPEPWHSASGEELLSLADVYQVVGLSAADALGSAREFVQDAGITVVSLVQDRMKVTAVSKWELEQHLVERSGGETVFPAEQAHHELKDCLFVFPINFFHSIRASLNGTATLMKYGQFRDCFVGRATSKSIFERLGYRDEAGRPLKVTAYQFRHWLDTMAEDGGMSQIEIARHFGRKDIGHNAAYNQMTGLELAESIHKKRTKGKVQGPVTEAALKIKDPKRRSEFIISSTVTAHPSDIGICEHNWSATPCPNGRKCIACDTHTLEKGNPDHIARTQKLKSEAEEYVELARQETEDGTTGANNWLEFQKLTVERCDAALAVHNDASIPDGTLVELPSLRRFEDVNDNGNQSSSESETQADEE